jgi:hypothetical protein
MKNVAYKSQVIVLLVVMVFTQLCFSQDSTKNAGGASPPSELKRFEPFLGRYNAAVDWPGRNLKWEGTLEISKAIKGWYIESNLIKESAGPHRQWRLLVTWDNNNNRYRVWRFETAGVPPEVEGIVKFDGDSEWVAEWQNFPQPGGKKVTYFSRFRLKDNDELDIITETVDNNGKKEDLGIVICKRKK